MMVGALIFVFYWWILFHGVRFYDDKRLDIRLRGRPTEADSAGTFDGHALWLVWLGINAILLGVALLTALLFLCV
jgi:hypothetical protein